MIFLRRGGVSWSLVKACTLIDKTSLSDPSGVVTVLWRAVFFGGEEKLRDYSLLIGIAVQELLVLAELYPFEVIKQCMVVASAKFPAQERAVIRRWMNRNSTEITFDLNNLLEGKGSFEQLSEEQGVSAAEDIIKLFDRSKSTQRSPEYCDIDKLQFEMASMIMLHALSINNRTINIAEIINPRLGDYLSRRAYWQEEEMDPYDSDNLEYSWCNTRQGVIFRALLTFMSRVLANERLAYDEGSRTSFFVDMIGVVNYRAWMLHPAAVYSVIYDRHDQAASLAMQNHSYNARLFLLQIHALVAFCKSGMTADNFGRALSRIILQVRDYFRFLADEAVGESDVQQVVPFKLLIDTFELIEWRTLTLLNEGAQAAFEEVIGVYSQGEVINFQILYPAEQDDCTANMFEQVFLAFSEIPGYLLPQFINYIVEEHVKGGWVKMCIDDALLWMPQESVSAMISAIISFGVNVEYHEGGWNFERDMKEAVGIFLNIVYKKKPESFREFYASFVVEDILRLMLPVAIDDGEVKVVVRCTLEDVVTGIMAEPSECLNVEAAICLLSLSDERFPLQAKLDIIEVIVRDLWDMRCVSVLVKFLKSQPKESQLYAKVFTLLGDLELGCEQGEIISDEQEFLLLILKSDVLYLSSDTVVAGFGGINVAEEKATHDGQVESEGVVRARACSQLIEKYIKDVVSWACSRQIEHVGYNFNLWACILDGLLEHFPEYLDGQWADPGALRRGVGHMRLSVLFPIIEKRGEGGFAGAQLESDPVAPPRGEDNSGGRYSEFEYKLN